MYKGIRVLTPMKGIANDHSWISMMVPCDICPHNAKDGVVNGFESFHDDMVCLCISKDKSQNHECPALIQFALKEGTEEILMLCNSRWKM